MDVSTGDLVSELKILRKGRGVAMPQLAERVGPALRAICRLAVEDNATETRRKISERLTILSTELPDDLRTVVLAAFGLAPDARMPFYQDRVHWAAARIDRDDRTARRRIDVGITQLAELAISALATDSVTTRREHQWHTEELRVALAADRPMPEAFEFRRVVADTDDLTELDLALTLTAPPSPRSRARKDDRDVDVFHGGILTSRRKESSDRFGLALKLPLTLNQGDRHEIALRFRATIEPHYVCVPRHPCDLFDLHVRLGNERAPREVILLDKAFQDRPDLQRAHDLVVGARRRLPNPPVGRVLEGRAYRPAPFRFGTAALLNTFHGRLKGSYS
ncbi:hypothetical protein [Amycolatopsis sp. NPDC051071]|uniref:hypothetical protein n=1 Tax=Amycolatopsis sp. NPDC051071 TaxID=3154637 RepID=UPI003430D6FA